MWPLDLWASALRHTRATSWAIYHTKADCDLACKRPGWRAWAVSEKKALASRASPTCLRRRLCAPLGDALRSCPKLGGARQRSEELAPAASATCERSASMAIRPRSWSREHQSDCGEAHALPVAPARAPLRQQRQQRHLQVDSTRSNERVLQRSGFCGTGAQLG